MNAQEPMDYITPEEYIDTKKKKPICHPLDFLNLADRIRIENYQKQQKEGKGSCLWTGSYEPDLA